jgi:hypothetical protein
MPIAGTQVSRQRSLVADAHDRCHVRLTVAQLLEDVEGP